MSDVNLLIDFQSSPNFQQQMDLKLAWDAPTPRWLAADPPHSAFAELHPKRGRVYLG